MNKVKQRKKFIPSYRKNLPDFWSRFRSIFSFWTTYPPQRVLSDKKAREADRKALQEDWDLVGQDMWDAIKENNNGK